MEGRIITHTKRAMQQVRKSTGTSDQRSTTASRVGRKTTRVITQSDGSKVTIYWPYERDPTEREIVDFLQQDLARRQAALPNFSDPSLPFFARGALRREVATSLGPVGFVAMTAAAVVLGAIVLRMGRYGVRHVRRRYLVERKPGRAYLGVFLLRYVVVYVLYLGLTLPFVSSKRQVLLFLIGFLVAAAGSYLWESVKPHAEHDEP
jgi:hypothetical protein